MRFWLLLMILTMPWKPEYINTLFIVGIVEHNSPCYFNGNEYSGWIGADNRIHLCPSLKCIRKDLLLLHESQHLLARLYLGNISDHEWADFDMLAMNALHANGYDSSVILQANTILNWNLPGELHAELPRILGPDIPPELQDWYPWFDLSDSRVGSSQEDTSRSVFQRCCEGVGDDHSWR